VRPRLRFRAPIPKGRGGQRREEEERRERGREGVRTLPQEEKKKSRRLWAKRSHVSVSQSVCE